MLQEISCLIDSLLCPYLDKFVIVFIDDVLIYSKNEEEHVENLGQMLILLRENQWYANLSKFSFFQKKIHYFGHFFSIEGIVVDPEKIIVIMEWESPRNVDEVRPLMGLVCYYRRLIRKFSWISYHITPLQRKGKKF